MRSLLLPLLLLAGAVAWKRRLRAHLRFYADALDGC